MCVYGVCLWTNRGLSSCQFAIVCNEFTDRIWAHEGSRHRQLMRFTREERGGEGGKMVGKLVVGERGRGNKRERGREKAQKKLKLKLKGKMGKGK